MDAMEQQFFAGLKESLKRAGLGVTFSEENVEQLSFPESLLGRLVYNVDVFATEKEFFFVNDENKLLYKGNVDAEGLIATIENEILELNALVNTYMCLANDDEVMLQELSKNVGFISSFFGQMIGGYGKGAENGHYDLPLFLSLLQ